MTDAEKNFVEEDMPRFASLEDAQKYEVTSDLSLAVPRYIRKGNEIITNPAWIDAPYGRIIIWGPSKKL